MDCGRSRIGISVLAPVGTFNPRLRPFAQTSSRRFTPGADLRRKQGGRSHDKNADVEAMTNGRRKNHGYFLQKNQRRNKR